MFHNGNIVSLSIDIELKRKRAGNLGKMCGCAANIIIPFDITDPIFKIAFPDKILEMAKERKGLFIWDASILNDPEDQGMYFGEFCPNRFGWDAIQTEIDMAGGVKSFLNAIVNDKPIFNKGIYGFSVRLFIDGKEDNVAIDTDYEAKPHVWPMYVYSDKEHIMLSGFSDDAVVVTSHNESLQEAIDDAYDIVEKNISLANAVYRPKEDILSTSYSGNLISRFNYIMDNGLVEGESFAPKRTVINLNDEEMLHKLMTPIIDYVKQSVEQQASRIEQDYHDQLSLERKMYLNKLRSIADE